MSAGGAIGRRLWPLWLLAAACHRSPPPSRFPSADAALARMHESQACSRGVRGAGKIDYFGPSGRVRGSLLYLASIPDRVRLDVVSPFGATLSTLTSDGTRFSLFDLRQKSFERGAANACNLRRFTRVPLPPHALVGLLRGEAPVLVHDAAQTSIEWDSGSYLLRINGRHRAEQEIRLLPADQDYALDWTKQRVRVIEVRVRQAGVELFRVELDGYARTEQAPPREDPEGILPPLPASGPECSAETPRVLRFVVEAEEHDLLLSSDEMAHNPPLSPGAFEQPIPRGVVLRDSPCPP